MKSVIGGEGAMMIGFIWTFWTLILAATILRLYTRLFILKKAGIDDGLAVIVVIVVLLCSVFNTMAGVYGMGRPQTEFKLWEIPIVINGAKWAFLASSTILWASALSKCVVIVFLLRLVVEKWHRIILWVILYTCIVFFAFLFFVTLLRCQPIASIWDPFVVGKCWAIHHNSLIHAGSIYASVLDIVLAILPWHFIWKLNMKRRDRLTIALSLSLGIFAGLAGIVRSYYLFTILGKRDQLGRMARIIIATSAEIAVTVICYTVPVLRPLWSKRRGESSNISSYTMHNRRWGGTGASRNKQDSISSKSEERILGRSSLERTASSPSRGPEKGGINVHKETIITYGGRRPDELLWQWDLERRH